MQQTQWHTGCLHVSSAQAAHHAFGLLGPQYIACNRPLHLRLSANAVGNIHNFVDNVTTDCSAVAIPGAAQAAPARASFPHASGQGIANSAPTLLHYLTEPGVSQITIAGEPALCCSSWCLPAATAHWHAAEPTCCSAAASWRQSTLAFLSLFHPCLQTVAAQPQQYFASHSLFPWQATFFWTRPPCKPSSSFPLRSPPAPTSPSSLTMRA